MAAPVQLTTGAVAAISEVLHGAATLKPVLQVVDLRMVTKAKSPIGERYRLMLSDGVHMLQCMLSTAKNALVRDSTICKGSILHLLEYTCSTIQGRRISILVEIKVLQTHCKLIGNPKLYESGRGISTALRPAENGADNFTCAGCCGESHPGGQGTAATFVRKTVAEIINGNLGFSDKQELITVKATLAFINTDNFCYAACPLVVNGRQCLMEVASNGNGWWYCHSCNHTFVTCDYQYRIFIGLEDSTGNTYAPASQEAGVDIFGHTAKELYIMRCENQHQFAEIVAGVQLREYLFKLKLEVEESIGGSKFPKCTIVKVETVNPSTECHHLLREINKHLQEDSGSSSTRHSFVDAKTGCTGLQGRFRVLNCGTDYAMNIGGVPYLA